MNKSFITSLVNLSEIYLDEDELRCFYADLIETMTAHDFDNINSLWGINDVFDEVLTESGFDLED